MKKILLLLGLCLVFPQVSFGAVVYEQTHIGQNISVGVYDFSAYYFAGTTPANPPTVMGAATLSRPVFSIKVKLVSGSCSDFSYNGNTSWVNGDSQHLLPASWTISAFVPAGKWSTVSDATGNYCIGTFNTPIPQGAQISQITLGSNNILDGSDQNGGISLNGWYANQKTGGFAFQLCDSDGCSNSFGSFSSSTPSLSSLVQFKSDGVTLINEGAVTSNTILGINATLTSPSSSLIKLQVELKPTSQVFDGTNILESSFMSPDSIATITSNTLTEGSYHWRTRAVDDKGNTSEWQEFGRAGNSDFVISFLPAPTSYIYAQPDTSKSLFVTGSYSFIQAMTPTPVTVDGKVNQFTLYVKSALPYDFATLSPYILLGRCPTQQTLKTVAGYNGGPGACQDYGGNYMSTYYSNYSVSVDGQYVTFTLNTPFTVYAGDYLFFYFQPGISGTNYTFELGASSAFAGCNFVNANNTSSNAINNCGGNSIAPAVWFSYVDLTEPTTGPVQQLNKDTRLEAPWNSGNWFPALGDQTLGTGLTGTLNSVSIWGKGNHNQIFLIEYSDSNYSVSPNYVITKSGLSGILTGGGGKISYTLPVPITLDPTKYYKLSIATMATDYAMTQPVLYGSNTDVYPNGQAQNSQPSDPRFNVGSIADFYFDLDITAPESQECTVDCYSNIMFLPGVMGTRLYSDQFSLIDCANAVPPINLDSPSCKPSERELWVSMNDDVLQERLKLDTNGKSVNTVYTKDDTRRDLSEFLGTTNEKGIVDDAYTSNIYESFVNDLRDWKGINDSGIIHDYAFIPYDWRLSLEDIVNNGATSTPDKLSYAGSTASGQYILKQLQALQKSSRTGKVTIVAHSNGGLVAKALIEKLKLDGNPLYNQIDKVILVAVPQVGTPEAVADILHGTSLGQNFVMTAARFRDLAKNMPAAYNMLPSAQYFNTVEPGFAVDKVVSFENVPFFNPQLSQYGVFVSNETELRNYMLGSDGRSAPVSIFDVNSPNIGNETLYTKAQTAHLMLDNWQPAPDTKVIQVAGWGEDTLAGIDYTYDDKLSLKLRHVVDGDGTVVVPSALWMATSTPGVERWWVNLNKYNKFYAMNLSRVHSDIMEVDNLREFIKSEIKNSSFTDNVVVNSTSTLTSDGERLHFTLHSPLTLGITDSSGRYTGLDSVTGEIKEEIPNTMYKQYGEVQFLSVPAGLQYTLKLKGYEAGTFALDVEKQIGNTVTESTTFQAIPTETTTAVTMDITPAFEVASSTLNIDQSGDGVVDVSIDANPSGVTIYDLTAPVTIVTPQGTLGSNGYYTSTITVTLTTDDTAHLGEVSSGVAGTKYSLDNGTTWNTYSTSTPLVIATEGTTTLQYYSEDNNGNSETPKTLTLNIDTVAPTIFASDVSAEQLTPSGTNLVINATAEDNVDANPVLASSIPLTQTFAPGTTEIALIATDMAGNTSTSTVTVTIFSSLTADPDGDCVINADDVNPFDPNVFANLVIPAEYSFWEKDRFTLPFSVAGKGIAKLSLSATYYKVSDNPIRDTQGVIVPSTSTEVDGIITITFPQNTKELTTYALELTTKKGNTKERDSIKKKWDNEGDGERRHELEKEFDFASAPITLFLQSLSCPNITSQSAIVNIYDKQQNAQVQYKYKDIGSLDFVMKSDDVIKIKKGQPLVLTVKVTGVKKNVTSEVSLSGNFSTLSVIQEDEHHDSDDRKQKTFILFYPLSIQTAQESITVNLTVGGVVKSAVLSVRFEE